MKKERSYSKKGNEIYGLALMILSVLILIFTVFDSFLAPIGAKFIKSFIMGVFGFAHYAMFITVFSFGFILFKGYTLQIPLKKTFSILGMFFFVLLILHLISSARFLGKEVSFASYISKCYDFPVTFGGVILGALIYPVYSILGLIGSYVLFSVLFIIFALTFIDFDKLKKLKTKNIISSTQNQFKNRDYEKRSSGNSLFISNIIKAEKKSNSDSKGVKSGVQKIYNLSRDYYNALEENKKKYNTQKINLGFNDVNAVYPSALSGINEAVKPGFGISSGFETKSESPSFYSKPMPDKIIHNEKPDFNIIKKPEPANVIDAEKRSKEILLSKINNNQTNNAEKNETAQKASPKFPNIIDGEIISQKLRESRHTNTDDSVIKEFKEILKKGSKNQIYNEPQIFTDNTQASMTLAKRLNRNVDIENNIITPEKISSEQTPSSMNSTRPFGVSEEISKDDNQRYEGYFKINPPKPSLNIDNKINETVLKEVQTVKEPSIKKNSAVEDQVNLEDIMYSDKPTVLPSVKKAKVEFKRYIKPPIDLLHNNSTYTGIVDENINESIASLEQVLDDFKTPAKVIGVTKGPAVTRYELQMPPGISVKKIADKADDIAYTMASNGKVRIETPIPGKQAVGIEIPNNIIEVVSLRELIESREFNMHNSSLAFALGKDIAGKNIVTDLVKMPHLLVAGATNSGKSSCLNALITSIIYRSSPLDVRFILIDPKRVEFTSYKGLPHMLLENPITEPEYALNAFEWAIEESEKRFELFVSYKVRDINDFNNMSVVKNGDVQKLPYIIIVVDELADLMAQSKRDFEDKIRSIAQKSRAAGIHLVLATQRPSVDVITGTIKANLPSRIAFSVTSFADSKTILDQGGADRLLGRGDMLYAPVDKPEPFRVQGAYVTNDEVYDVVNFIKENNQSFFDKDLEERILKTNEQDTNDGVTVANFVDDSDPNLPNIMRMFLELGQASTTLIQRRFRYGYAKAARTMDQLELKKYISAFDGTNKPRKVLITPEQFEEEFGEPFDLQQEEK